MVRIINLLCVTVCVVEVPFEREALPDHTDSIIDGLGAENTKA